MKLPKERISYSAIVDRPPLPANTGGRQRMWNLILAMASLGDGSLLIASEADDESLAATRSALPGWTVRVSPPVARRESPASRALRLLFGQAPPTVGLDLAPSVEAAKQLATGADVVLAVQPLGASIAAMAKCAVGRPES